MNWRSPWLVRTAKIVVSVVLVVAVVWQVGPTAVIPREIEWKYLTGAVALFLLSNCIGAFQWSLLLRSAEIDLPTRTVWRAYFIALFFNNFFIGNVGGDVLRALDVRREAPDGSHGKTAAGVSTIVMDRFLGFFTMMWYAGAAAWMSHEYRVYAAPIAGLLIAFVLLGIVLTSRRVGTRFDRFVVRLLPKRMATTILNLRVGFVAMRRRWVSFVAATSVAAVVQGLRIVVHFLCALSIGLVAPIGFFFTFIPLVGVAAGLPVSMGGLGTREWAAVALFQSAGISGAAIVTTELLAQVVTLVTALPGAAAFIGRGSRAPRVLKAEGT